MSDDFKAQIAALKDKFKEVERKIDVQMEPLLVKAALMVERTAKENMTPNGPSAPGEPPAVDTGRLRASISHRVVREGKMAVAEVGTNVEYAVPLEFGTSKMAKRPFMEPALLANKNAIEELFKESVENASD